MLGNAAIESLEARILKCIKSLKTSDDDRVILVAAGLDVLLATTESPAQDLLNAIQEWRQVSRLQTPIGAFQARLLL